MRAFIVRPFGTKQGVDFDRVETELIGPALTRLGIDGRTTGEVIEAGNIREDMFQLLLVSDVVVADISIDNANVYYELGVRQALREKRTFLIRASGMNTEVPFDLRTDRYLRYDPANPGATLDALVAGLRATIDSERQDSPVFRVLPELREHDRAKFLPLPREFREEVEYAAKSGHLGKLALLGDEARGSVWESEGLRLVGREQFKAKAFEAAAVTLESLRALDPLDGEANLLLGTIYQRLGDLPKSEVALQRVIDKDGTGASNRAEVSSLLGRNLKSQWCDAWKAQPDERRRTMALASPFLMRSYEAYLNGFRQDLNHFYSGLNALAMLTIVLELSKAQPEEWEDGFASSDEAQRARAGLESQWRLLAGAVDFSIQASKKALEQRGAVDPWVDVSLADFTFLTTDRPGAIARVYESALANQPEFVSDSVRTQLQMYRELGIVSEKVTRVLSVLSPASPAKPSEAATRTIVFTGHQIDAPGRKEPRFPASQESAARAAIREQIETQVKLSRGGIEGLAGAASGGDILFHEVCAELGIKTRLFLALPPEAYCKESVAPAEGNWVGRFWTIVNQHAKAPVLSQTTDLPGWLRHRARYSIWQRNNLWTLYAALVAGASNVTVLALWNGKQGDGPGGTADMIEIARARGAETHVIDTNVTFKSATE